MREEFKFVRGLYTKKKLFDADIINDSFVILDEKGVEVSFDAEDDSKTQSQLINASSDGRVRKVYTITPDKITMEGNLEKEGDYKFTPTVKEIIDDEIIPGNVKTKAETFLKEHLTADYTALTAGKIGIGENSNPDFVDVIFTDNNAKSFTRKMKFRVEGKVNKSSFVNIERGTVDPEETQVYVLNSNGDRYDIATGVSDTDLFIKGRKQESVGGTLKNFPAESVRLQISGDGNSATAECVAHKYIAPNGYIFDVTNSEELPASYIGEYSGTTSYNLSIKDGAVGRTDLTFDISKLGVSNYIYADFVASVNLYMIASGNLEKITKDNYPYGKTLYTYDKGDYNVYNGSVYKNDSSDLNTYKVAGSPENINVSKGLVKVELDNKTISPIHNFEKEGYIITIDENKISITARES